MHKRKKFLFTCLALFLVITVIYITATEEKCDPPNECPDRTLAFAEVFDTLCHIYPEANFGTSMIVLQIIDFNEIDYNCAVDAITDYCKAENISLLCVGYGEDIPDYELTDADNLVITFSELRYKKAKPNDTKITFRAQKYRPGVAGYYLDVACVRKQDLWDCFWTNAKEINVADLQ